MPEAITFTAYCDPVGKARPRVTRTGHVYTPKRTTNFEAEIARAARPHFDAPLSAPVRVTIWATFKPAKSWSKAKTASAMHGPHTQKPDLDNVEKAVLDALNGIAFTDDSLVAEKSARKVWGPVARVVVTVEPISGWQSIGSVAKRVLQGAGE